MGRPLCVLVIEDVEADAELVIRELRRGGFDVTAERVDTPEALVECLPHQPWDLAISDYSMPRFSAPQALRLVKGYAPDLPFIIVSGTVGEDIAVESLHAGAQDFMAKGRLGRLVPAVERELRDAAMRVERKKMQDQLLLSDRMASMGTLAAGVAHELNNPLACVMANLELAARELAELAEQRGLVIETRDLRDELQDAREGAERLRTIVRDLKIFSRPEAETTGPVDVIAVMESTLRMAWNEIRHRARLNRQFGPTPPVEASETRLGQVFLNLLINAAQAMPEGRAGDNTITVTTGVAAGGQVVVEVTDTGTGMPPDVLNRLFTPFFSTKPVGVGTGLGLSICQRIVTGFGGTITVASEVGRGTTFRVALPVAAGAVAARAAATLAEAAPRRRGRILVIDDEPMVAKVLSRTLGVDHTVVTASRATEALARIAAEPPFDLVLCDIMMPQMTGVELYEEVRRRDPAVAEGFIFLTGGAFTASARAFLDSVPNQRVEKPFDPHHVRALINERLR